MQGPWFKRLLAVCGRLKHLPAALRMTWELVEAQDEAAKHNYLAAERRLLRIYAAAPSFFLDRSTTNLLMSLVSLRLGNPQAAADLAPVGVRDVGSLRAYANPAERAYLKYVGRLILEEATQRLGAPQTIDVGVELDDIDVQRVRHSLRSAFPIAAANGANGRQLH